MLSIAAWVTLIGVDLVVPLVLGILAAHSNARYRNPRTSERLFWGFTGGYLLIVGLLALGLIELVAHPQQEGLAAFSAAAVQWFLTLPGSLATLGMYLSLSGAPTLHQAGADSLVIFSAVGNLCWAFFDVVGIRWLSQIGGRARAHNQAQAAAAHPDRKVSIQG
jgi:hypothetical protein